MPGGQHTHWTSSAGASGTTPAGPAAGTIHMSTNSLCLHPTTHLQLQQAQQAILGAIRGSRGRGKSPLTPEQVEELEAAVDVLERDGGVQVRHLRLFGYKPAFRKGAFAAGACVWAGGGGGRP